MYRHWGIDVYSWLHAYSWFHNSLYCRWQTRSVWSQPLKMSQTVSGPNGIRTNTPKIQSTGSSELRKPDDVLMHVATPWAVGSGVLLDITMREPQLIQSKFNQVWSLDSQMIVWICSLQTISRNHAWHWVCIIFLVLCRCLWTVKSSSNKCGVHVCIPWNLHNCDYMFDIYETFFLISDHLSVNVNPWVCLCVLVRKKKC